MSPFHFSNGQMDDDIPSPDAEHEVEPQFFNFNKDNEHEPFLPTGGPHSEPSRRPSQKRSRLHGSPTSSNCDFEMVFETALDSLMNPKQAAPGTT